MIKIGENARLKRADERNIELEIKKKVMNKKTKRASIEWVHVGWFSNLKSAMQFLLKNYSNKLVDEELDIKEVIIRLDAMERELLGVKIADIK